MVELARLAIQPILVLPILSMAAYLGVLLFFASTVGIWDASLIKATLVWFVVVAVGLLFKSLVTAGEGHLLRRTVVASILPTCAAVPLNFVVFGLLWELILVSVISVLVLMLPITETNRELKGLGAFIERLLAWIGLALAIYLAFTIAKWSGAEWRSALVAIALPACLTLSAMPFIYIAALGVVYDSLFNRVDVATKDAGVRRRGKIALLCVLGLRIRDAGPVYAQWAKDLAEASSLGAARMVVRETLIRGSAS